jgi:hypothetical protein
VNFNSTADIDTAARAVYVLQRHTNFPHTAGETSESADEYPADRMNVRAREL